MSKYCHLPESSMTIPFRGVAYCACLLCNRGSLHFASHNNQISGWVRGILQAQLESANQTYLYSSSAFSQTRKPFPAFISSLHSFYNKRMSGCPYKPPHTRLSPPFYSNIQSKVMPKHLINVLYNLSVNFNY